MNIIDLQQLILQRQSKPLCAPINATITMGELVWVQGKNGSGKTTLLQTICGLIPPQKGVLKIHKKIKLGYLTHLYGLHPDLTIIENWKLYATLMNARWSVTKTKELAHYFDIWDIRDTLPLTLSAGQIQKSKLVKFLLGNHHTWLLDEPYTHLDQKASHAFSQLINHELDSKKTTIVITSHQALQQTPQQTILLQPC